VPDPASNVLFVNTSPDVMGGGQVSLLELIRAIDRKQFRPYAVVGADGPMRQRLDDLGVGTFVVDLSPLRGPHVCGPLGAIHSLSRVIAGNAIRLVHTNDTRAHIYAGIAARRNRIPAVFHFRVAYSDGIYDRMLGRLGTRIVAVSTATAARFPGLADKVEVIPNAVDPERFRPGAPGPGLPDRLRGRTPLVGTIGRLEKAKGGHCFLETVARLKRDYPRLGAVIVGRGALEPELTGEARRLGLDDDVVFEHESPDVPSLLAALDVYVLLSDNEGLNRSILEAMACGTPVVATRVGGNTDVISAPRFGRLVPWNDAGAATSAVGEFLADAGLRSEVAEAGRERVVAGFSLGMQTRRIEKLFATLIGLQ
jgi:glycosyltransferase involved in cell wall biosynthesis